jgi:glycerol-3-phosphate acyltransferase PlsX
MKIAIDAMGGDHAPEQIVAGALEAAVAYPDTTLILVGDEARLRALVKEWPANVTLHHAGEVIESDDEPAKAVRRKKDASMVVAGRLVKEKQADAMISAGNTGALMATGLLVVGRLPGIERPAIASMIPTVDGAGFLALDLGANMDATPEQLCQYAVMGSIYCRQVNGIERPRVGLLNVGTEAMKGNEAVKAAHGLIGRAPLNFVGNVESRDVMFGNCDVLVCDGFVGNVFLKTLEGTAAAIFSMLKAELAKDLSGKLAGAVLKPRLRQFKNKLDYSEYGGAPLLGLAGVVIKAHGSSDATALKNAVRQARQALMNGLVDALAQGI